MDVALLGSLMYGCWEKKVAFLFHDFELFSFISISLDYRNGFFTILEPNLGFFRLQASMYYIIRAGWAMRRLKPARAPENIRPHIIVI